MIIKDHKRKGDIAEHYAVSWLWEQGYEVFKNSGCSGAVDIIAMNKEGEFILLDIKTAKRDERRKNKYVSVGGRGLSEQQKKLGIQQLVFDPTTKEFRFVKHLKGTFKND